MSTQSYIHCLTYLEEFKAIVYTVLLVAGEEHDESAFVLAVEDELLP